MTTSDINDFRSKSTTYIAQEQLYDAFRIMRTNATKLNNSKMLDDVANLETSYKFLLQYFTNGSADPDRDKQYRQIQYATRILADRMYREMCIDTETTSYYNTLKYTRLRPDETIIALAEKYRQELARLEFDLSAVTSPTYRAQAERIAGDLFNLLWVTFPYTKADTDCIRQLLNDSNVPDFTKQLLIGGVMLGLLQFYDFERFTLLLDAYEGGSCDAAALALTGIVIALFRYRKRDHYQPLLDRLKQLAESGTWSSDVTTVFLELIRATDTENISRKLHNDVLPGMMRMGDDLMRKIKDGELDITDPESLEANPEWDELMNKEGFANKLKDFTESQLRGDDIFMSTFAGQKSDPFFRDVANWFMPFHPDHSAVADIILSMTNADSSVSIADMVTKARMLCDSDKYSMIFSLAQIPTQQRDMVTSQLSLNRDDIDHLSGSEIDDATKFRRAVNICVKNLYRFFKLYRRKTDFFNPFGYVISPMDIQILCDDVDRIAIGNYMFNKKLYTQVYQLFTAYEFAQEVDAKFYQKLGYCAEKEGNSSEAMSHYRNADLLEPNNKWTLRRMARLYRQFFEYEEADKVYKALLELEPDDVDTLLNYGYMLIEYHLYDEALPIFYQVEYNQTASARAWRPIAWLLLLTKDYDGALTYYKRVLDGETKPTDYFNMGHVMWARGDVKAAIKYYRQYISMADGMTLETFEEQLVHDVMDIGQPEVMCVTSVSLIIDAIRYEMNE